MTQLVDKKYIYLKPVNRSPRTPTHLITKENLTDELLSTLFARLEGKVHFDLETTGLDWYQKHNDQTITVLGIAHSGGCFALDVRGFDVEMWGYVLTRLSECQLYAFNAAFDVGWLYRQCYNIGFDGQRIIDALAGCSATLYRGLANEGYAGQRHNLGVVQEDFLQWKDVNKEWLQEALVKHRLAKADMSELVDLEPEDFLYYCAIDAEASKQCQEELERQLEDNGDEIKLKFYYSEELLQVKELIEQQWNGMKVDREPLAAYYAALFAEREATKEAFRNHPLTKPLIDKWEEDNCQPVVKAETVEKKVIARKNDIVDPHTNDLLVGIENEWERDYERTNLKKWEHEFGAWKKTDVKTIEKVTKPKYDSFNINSNRQLIWLFYHNLYSYEYVDGYYRKSVNLHVGPRTVNLDLTKKGDLPIGKEVYPILGEPGQLLAKYNKMEKELGYIKKTLEKSEEDGRIHPGFVMYGTKTGRLAASGGINMQQQSKTEEYLNCFVPDEGHVFVDVDVTSLEPTVQAEFSGDSTLIDIYASGKSHDLYLWWARFIHPDAAFRAALQAEYVPDEETIAALKKKYKVQRSFIKAPVLGFSYGMGPRKLYKSLTIQGYDVTIDDCKLTYDNYWAKLQGIREWEQELLREWEYRGGWIKNAFGHPISLTEGYKKDIVNKFTQNSGHCVLQILNRHINELLKERGVKETPIIQDFHDERISMCRRDDADKLVDVFNEAFVRLNEELNPNIPFKGVPEIGESLWDFKK